MSWASQYLAWMRRTFPDWPGGHSRALKELRRLTRDQFEALQQEVWLERLRRAYADPKDGGRRRPTWSVPATPDDAPPSWDNVVRAYEDCRDVCD